MESKFTHSGNTFFEDERGFGIELHVFSPRGHVMGTMTPSYRWDFHEQAQIAMLAALDVVEQTGAYPNFCDPKVCEALAEVQ